jgi:hypothetical protein
MGKIDTKMYLENAGTVDSVDLVVRYSFTAYYIDIPSMRFCTGVVVNYTTCKIMVTDEEHNIFMNLKYFLNLCILYTIDERDIFFKMGATKGVFCCDSVFRFVQDIRRYRGIFTLC